MIAVCMFLPTFVNRAIVPLIVLLVTFVMAVGAGPDRATSADGSRAGALEPASGLSASSPASRPRSAVVVSIDSLRADHLPTYGYPRMTAPFLAQLARRDGAVVF